MKILTFDIEEWFHLLDHPDTRSAHQWEKFESRFERNLERVLSLVKASDCSATFFCLGWIAEKYPDLIKEIVYSGYEIACHSHRHQLAYQQAPEDFRRDFCEAREAIFKACGIIVDTYRLPGFSLTEDSIWALDILGEEGVEVDSSVFPMTTSHGGLPHFEIDQPCVVKTAKGHILKEFPLNTLSILGNRLVFSGGGYFRLLPYWMLKKYFTESEYVLTYFHPRDFDPDQPVLPNLSFGRKFKSYVGLKNAEAKLVKLLGEFDFMDVRTAVSTINWQNVRIVEL